MFRRLLSIMLSLVMVMGMSTAIFAEDTVPLNSNVVIDGVTYTISEWHENGEKVVKVKSGESTDIVRYQDGHLEIDSNGTRLNIDIDESVKSNIHPRASLSSSAPFWNYSYYFADHNLLTYGMWFDLRSGDFGSFTGFDNKNDNARQLAYSFCYEVNNLSSQLWTATAASGASAGAVAFAIASAGPTLGVGGVIGIVAGILGAGVAVAEWVSARYTAMNCNSIFMQFEHSMHYGY